MSARTHPDPAPGTPGTAAPAARPDRTAALRPALPQITFDGLRREQIDTRWVARAGGLEAYVFDGADLATADRWDTLRANLRFATDLGAPRLTCHFPTANADWVGDTHAYDQLRRFCDLAADSGASGVVLHANQFVEQADWLDFDLRAARERTVARLAALDEDLDGSPLWIGVENLPVIGAEGIDYDSVFVRPDDYLPLLDLNSPRIGATWDVCHWAVTYTTLASIAQLQQRPPDLAPLALPPVPVKHIHFGSFSGRAIPFRTDVCVEGVPPQRGDIEQPLLAAMLRAAIEAADGPGVVLEIQEDDYLRREHCWTTLEWLTSTPHLRTCIAPAGAARD
ncbi:sugar phosphate isomerase/epimerase family protein [Streptomyces celluloflavus]|uniref:sugar phosphate isomerase/epimerase family protein n=1 Tax=Streptomyces celluloflavus TaxID=58344 RepID=UPI00365587C0